MVYDNGCFIVPILYWMLSVIWGIYDGSDFSGVGSAPVFTWLVVNILRLYLIVLKIS